MDSIFIDILTHIVLPIAVASIPAYIGFISQRKHSEDTKDKLDAETTKLITEAAGDMQGVYQKLMKDLEKQSNECKESLVKVLEEMNKIKDSNAELLNSNNMLNEKIIKQNEIIRSQNRKIEDLSKQVKILSNQLKDLGQIPKI